MLWVRIPSNELRFIGRPMGRSEEDNAPCKFVKILVGGEVLKRAQDNSARLNTLGHRGETPHRAGEVP